MKLTEAGQSRMNGYLFVFERSLASTLPGDAVREAVREIESHVLERVAQADPALDARESLEKILSDLGSPQRVAEAYSLGRTVDDAVVTGRLVPVARAIGRIAVSTVGGFFAAIALFVGYAIGAAFLLIAAAKPIWPGHVGLIVVDGFPRSFGIALHVPPGAVVYGGYALIPIALVSGLLVLVVTHRAARRFLARWRDRQPAFLAQPKH